MSVCTSCRASLGPARSEAKHPLLCFDCAHVVLQPFQMLMGRRLGGDVRIDARRLDPSEYAKLGRWIAERVTCRFAPPYEHSLTVLYD